MQFSQIHHCSMAVKDLERAAMFYRDVLGLTEIVIPSTFKPAGLNVRWFRLGSQQIHLLLEVETHIRPANAFVAEREGRKYSGDGAHPRSRPFLHYRS